MWEKEWKSQRKGSNRRNEKEPSYRFRIENFLEFGSKEENVQMYIKHGVESTHQFRNDSIFSYIRDHCWWWFDSKFLVYMWVCSLYLTTEIEKKNGCFMFGAAIIMNNSFPQSSTLFLERWCSLTESCKTNAFINIYVIVFHEIIEKWTFWK